MANGKTMNSLTHEQYKAIKEYFNKINLYAKTHTLNLQYKSNGEEKTFNIAGAVADELGFMHLYDSKGIWLNFEYSMDECNPFDYIIYNLNKIKAFPKTQPFNLFTIKENTLCT